MSNTLLDEQDIKAFEPEAKIGLLATLDERGLPHLSLITSLQAKSATQLMWGQFCEGRSKEHVRREPRTAFAVMTAERRLWRGKAKWTGAVREGEDFVRYNQLPMFRYNAYFGIHTVHYMDLVELSDRGSVSLPRLLAGVALVRLLGRRLAQADGTEPALKPWAQSHLSKPSTLKYLAYRDLDGFPAIIPVLPCEAATSGGLVLSPTVFGRELRAIGAGTTVAVFGLNLEMESVLVRGRYGGIRSHRGVPLGTVDIDWVYNSMPPQQGPIYPAQPLGAVREP